MVSKFSKSVCIGESLRQGELEIGAMPELTPPCIGTMYKCCTIPGYEETM
jgi:hypothetical protein